MREYPHPFFLGAPFLPLTRPTGLTRLSTPDGLGLQVRTIASAYPYVVVRKQALYRNILPRYPSPVPSAPPVLHCGVPTA
jgi:hypothetical protein